MVQKSKIQNLRYLIFFNNNRGIEILKVLKKKKLNFDVIITRKYLNLEVIEFLKKNKLQYKLINNLKKIVIRESYDLFIVAGFPHIFSEKLLNLPSKGVINLHAGPLPEYRGGSPLSWQIINNEKKIGITFFKMNKYLDKGKILLKKYFKLNKNENILHAQLKSNKLFSKHILTAISKLLKKDFISLNIKGTYFNQRSHKDGKIDLSKMSQKEIRNLIRALYPYYKPPFILFRKKKIYIKNFSRISKNSNNKFIFKFQCRDGIIGLLKKDILKLN